MSKNRRNKAPAEDEGISEQHVWDFLETTGERPEISAPSLEESLQRRRILHELDLSFNTFQTINASGIKGKASSSPSKLSKKSLRSKETEIARKKREDLLYESVLRIFEIQLKLEMIEKGTPSKGGLAPLTLSVPKNPSMLAKKRSSIVLPKLPKLPSFAVFRRSVSDPDPDG